MSRISPTPTESQELSNLSFRQAFALMAQYIREPTTTDEAVRAHALVCCGNLEQAHAQALDEVAHRKRHEEKLEDANKALVVERDGLVVERDGLNGELREQQNALEEAKEANEAKDNAIIKKNSKIDSLQEQLIEETSLHKPLAKALYPESQNTLTLPGWGKLSPYNPPNGHRISRARIDLDLSGEAEDYSADLIDLLLYEMVHRHNTKDEKQAVDLFPAMSLSKWLTSNRSLAQINKPYALIPINVLPSEADYSKKHWVLLFYKNDGLHYADPKQHPIPAALATWGRKLNISISPYTFGNAINEELPSGSYVVEQVEYFFNSIRSGRLNQDDEKQASSAEIHKKHKKLKRETIAKLDAVKNNLLSEEKGTASTKKIGEYLRKLGLTLVQDGSELQYNSVNALVDERYPPQPQIQHENNENYQLMADAPADLSEFNPYIDLAYKHRSRLLIIEATLSQEYQDGCFEIEMTHHLAGEEKHYTQIDQSLEALVEVAHSIEDLSIIPILKVGQSFFPLEGIQPSQQSCLYREQPLCCNTSCFTLLVLFIALADALGHGMLNAAQLTKNGIIEADPEKHLASFLFVSTIASTPKLFYGFNKLKALKKRIPFGRYALVHPTMEGREPYFFGAWTLLAAAIDGLITFNAVKHLTNSSVIASIISLGDFTQFSVVEGSALAHKFSEPLFELERKLWARPVQDAFDRVKKILPMLLVNALTFYGMAAITSLAADEIHEFLQSHFSDEHKQQVGTVVLTTLYFIYNYCLYAGEMKEALYDLSEMNCDELREIKNTARERRGWSLWFWIPGMLSLLGSSAFLNTITAEMGVRDLFDRFKFNKSLQGVSYSAGATFALMAFTVTGLPLVRWVIGKKKTFPTIHLPSGLKRIYDIRQALTHFGTMLLLASPRILFDLITADSNDDKFKLNYLRLLGLSAISGLLFTCIYLNRVRTQSKRTGIPFYYCDSSCVGKAAYQYKLRLSPPTIQELLEPDNKHTIFIFLVGGEIHYRALERSLTTRVVDERLQAGPEVTAKITKALLTLAREQQKQPNRNQPIDLNVTQWLTESDRTRTLSNLFWRYPHLATAFSLGANCTMIMIALGLLISSIHSIDDRLNHRFKAVSFDLLGAALGSAFSVILLRFTTHGIGHEARPDNRKLYRLNVFPDVQENNGDEKVHESSLTGSIN